MTQTKPNSQWLALILLCATQFMMVLDFSIVNVALSAIQKDLSFLPQNLQWLITAYGLTCGGFLSHIPHFGKVASKKPNFASR